MEAGSRQKREQTPEGTNNKTEGNLKSRKVQNESKRSNNGQFGVI